MLCSWRSKASIDTLYFNETVTRTINTLRYYYRERCWFEFCQSTLENIHTLEKNEKRIYPLPEFFLLDVLHDLDPDNPYQLKEEIKNEFRDTFVYNIHDKLKDGYYAVFRFDHEYIDAYRLE